MPTGSTRRPSRRPIKSGQIGGPPDRRDPLDVLLSRFGISGTPIEAAIKGLVSPKSPSSQIIHVGDPLTMDSGVLAMLVVVAVLQASYTVQLHMKPRPVADPDPPWLVWLRDLLWILLLALGGVFLGLSQNTPKWLAASKGMIYLSVLSLQVSVRFVSDGLCLFVCRFLRRGMPWPAVFSSSGSTTSSFMPS